MKNLYGIILIIVVLGISSCTKEAEVSWATSHEFTIENIMGEEVNIIKDSDSHAVATNGFSKNETSKVLRGTQVAGSASSYVDQQIVGLSFHLIYTFKDDKYADTFTEDMFQSLWAEGRTHKLGKEGEGLFDNSFIYIGLLNEEGVLQKYVTEVNASDDNSNLEIISRQFSAKTDEGRDVYEVTVKYESRLVNMDDENDVLYLKDGIATLKVPNFSQENK